MDEQNPNLVNDDAVQLEAVDDHIFGEEGELFDSGFVEEEINENDPDLNSNKMESEDEYQENSWFNPTIKFQKLFNDACLPTKATTGSAGYDLFSCSKKVVEVGQRVKFSLGFRMLMPKNCRAKIYSRSGLATAHGICVAGGVTIIDQDFQGSISVCIYNQGPEDYTIRHHDRIAQMLFEFSPDVTFEMASNEDFKATPTERNHKGYGSTGR